MVHPSAESLLEQLSSFTNASTLAGLDAHKKKEIFTLAKKLMLQTESDRDAIDRLCNSILPTDIAQVAIDLKLFRIIAADPKKSWTIKELGEISGADSVLLHRLLRLLAVEGYVSERDNGIFQASSQTLALANVGAETAIAHYRLNVGPPSIALPAFLKSTSYANPSDSNNTAFMAAFSGSDIMTVVSTDPERAAAAFGYMASQRDGMRSWMDTPAYAVDLRLSQSDLDTDRILFVDVGGGSGHQCLALRQKLPELKGKMVLQEAPVMIGLIDREAFFTNNIIPLAHDFNTPQPTSCQGAKAYYMRNVLHDWTSEICHNILTHIRNAMADDSVILIDEGIVPATGAGLRQVSLDVIMMSVVAASERTREAWETLLDNAGLKIRDAWTYEDASCECLIVAVKK